MLKIRFQKPDGSIFRQFDMPAVPQVGDNILSGKNGWIVQDVFWDLADISGAEITVFLREP